jgi:hypothetical protein
MAIRATEALVNKLAQGYGIRDLMKDLQIFVYTGGQPASGDDAPTGNNLLIFTKDGVTYVAPTRSKSEIVLIGTGTLDTIKVGGMDFNLLSAAATVDGGNLDVSAAAIVADINGRENPLNIIATTDGVNTVTLWLPHWMGAEGDDLTAAITQTTSTCTIDAAFASGVTALNGMNFDFPASIGVIAKPVGEEWKGTGVLAGTAGWFRAVAGGSSVSSAGATEVRFDGVLQSSGGDLDMGSLSIEVGAIQTISELSITQPQSK